MGVEIVSFADPGIAFHISTVGSGAEDEADITGITPRNTGAFAGEKCGDRVVEHGDGAVATTAGQLCAHTGANHGADH